MEEFWMQIPPRSIIDEFISGEGKSRDLTEGGPVSHLKKRSPHPIPPGTKRHSGQIHVIEKTNGGTAHSARRLEKES
jgi:hypothetical protein